MTMRYNPVSSGNRSNAMALFIPVPDCVQIELNFTMSGERAQNILHYTNDSPSISNATALADDIIAYWVASMKDQVPATTILQNVRAVDLRTQFGFAIQRSTGLPVVGTRAGACLPNNCALVVTKRTALRGRSFRGRVYHAQLTETDVTDNTLASGFITSLISDYSGLITRTVGAEVWRLVVASRYFEGLPRVAGVTTEVTNFTAEPTVDSQRRRLPGRGN